MELEIKQDHKVGRELHGMFLHGKMRNSTRLAKKRLCIKTFVFFNFSIDYKIKLYFLDIDSNFLTSLDLKKELKLLLFNYKLKFSSLLGKVLLGLFFLICFNWLEIKPLS